VVCYRHNVKIEIVTINDESFKLNVAQFGTHFVATDGERVCIGSTETDAISGVAEMIEIAENVVVNNPPAERQKIPAPIENNKGAGWFAGTSWG